jgi:hypothetical protein
VQEAISSMMVREMMVKGLAHNRLYPLLAERLGGV